MAPDFSKNAILEGAVDFLCLVCETYLRNEGERDAHIVQENHIKLLNATHYVEEFEEERIKKINNKYFCELCNRIFPVLARVRLHVIESTHTDKKTVCSIKRIDNFIIACEEIMINEQSWQSFCEGQCAICNIEYDDEEKHKIEPIHILNLIQVKVVLDKDRNLYRKIDEDSFQCLTCNLVLHLNSVKSHFSDLEHKNRHRACRDAIHTINKFETEEVSDLTKNEQCSPTNNAKTTKLITESKKKKNDISQKHGDTKGTPEEKRKDILISLDKKISKKDSEYVYDEKIEEKIIQVLEATEYITRDENGQTWCILCSWVMDGTKAREHINGKHHQIILKLHRQHIEKLKQKN